MGKEEEERKEKKRIERRRRRGKDFYLLPYHSREMKLLAETDGKTRERAQTQEEEEGTTTAAAAGWARSWLGSALGLAGPFLFLFFFPFFIFTHTHTGAFIAEHDSCINIFSLSLLFLFSLYVYLFACLVPNWPGDQGQRTTRV